MPPTPGRITSYKVEISGINNLRGVYVTLPSTSFVPPSQTSGSSTRNVSSSAHDLSPLILQYKLGTNSELYQWVKDSIMGQGTTRSISVIFTDSTNKEVGRCQLSGCSPLKHSISKLSPINRCFETFEITVTGIDRT